MEKTQNYLKRLLWWLGIFKNCPKCGSKLIRVDESGWDSYKCSNVNCDFGKRHVRYPFEIWKR